LAFPEPLVSGGRLEAHVSAPQSAPEEGPRLSRPHEDGERPQGPEPPPCPWSASPDRQLPV